MDGSISDDLPAKRLGRLYSTNHYIVSMINPIVLPFLRNGGSAHGRLLSAAGKVGIELTREVLNSYREQVQKYGSDYPRFSWMVNGLHSLKAGEAAAWPELRAIDTCTKISRALDDILERFERGDLKPVRAARRRPKRPAKTPRKAKAKKTPVKAAREAAAAATAAAAVDKAAGKGAKKPGSSVDEAA